MAENQDTFVLKNFPFTSFKNTSSVLYICRIVKASAKRADSEHLFGLSSTSLVQLYAMLFSSSSHFFSGL